MKLTHNSLSTMIAWVSSCLLAGGISTMFSDDTRMLWMTWGYFGLASAVGLDITARVRERLRIEQLNRTAATRIDRDLNLEQETKESITAIREVIANLLSSMPSQAERNDTRRGESRHTCQISAELRPFGKLERNGAEEAETSCSVEITNLSIFGFEISLTEPLELNKVIITISTARNGRIALLGQILWCNQHADGSSLAGGRFLKLVSVERSDQQIHLGVSSSEVAARLATSDSPKHNVGTDALPTW